jgi:hypothetical protein
MKIGIKNPNKKRKRINPVSKKREQKKKEYFALMRKLIDLSGGRSELSGCFPDDWVECHHIMGRSGSLYTDPFNLIILTANEHRAITASNPFTQKLELLRIVVVKRQEQGFGEPPEWLVVILERN